jgi:rubrerythrin
MMNFKTSLLMLAKYKCLKCQHEYSHPPRPTECPKCGHLYVKWLNYEEMFGGRVLEEEYYEKLCEK